MVGRETIRLRFLDDVRVRGCWLSVVSSSAADSSAKPSVSGLYSWSTSPCNSFSSLSVKTTRFRFGAIICCSTNFIDLPDIVGLGGTGGSIAVGVGKGMSSIGSSESDNEDKGEGGASCVPVEMACDGARLVNPN
jgi:hypothetical protein